MKKKLLFLGGSIDLRFVENCSHHRTSYCSLKILATLCRVWTSTGVLNELMPDLNEGHAHMIPWGSIYPPVGVTERLLTSLEKPAHTRNCDMKTCGPSNWKPWHSQDCWSCRSSSQSSNWLSWWWREFIYWFWSECSFHLERKTISQIFFLLHIIKIIYLIWHCNSLIHQLGQINLNTRNSKLKHKVFDWLLDDFIDFWNYSHHPPWVLMKLLGLHYLMCFIDLIKHLKELQL